MQHKGQVKMGDSRFRPFLCVGLGYFVIAVIVPFILLPSYPEPGGWSHINGVIWSLLAGVAGAVGARILTRRDVHRDQHGRNGRRLAASGDRGAVLSRAGRTAFVTVGP